MDSLGKDVLLFEAGCKTFFDKSFELILCGIIDVYLEIIGAGRMVPRNDEEGIRDIIVDDYLKKDFKQRHEILSHYLFDKEIITESNEGRVDIRVMQIDPFVDDEAYYFIECKRLDGATGLNGKYVQEGIERFITGKYTFRNNAAGMLGFVVSCIDIDKNIESINRLCTNRITQTLMKKEIDKKSIRADFDYAYYSEHTEDKKVLYHIMLDFSGVLVP